jgi:tRNA (guanine37-N1)-methyltransferase
MPTFHVITLFPDLVSLYCGTSILGRGQSAERIDVKTYNPRDFCPDKYKKVDDTPYGGGAGMVMKPEPIYAAFESIERVKDSPVLLTSPRGRPFNQKYAEELSAHEDITIICGRYEGVDERVLQIVSDEISMGDFILTGGELAALIIVDAVGRLVPGVLGKSSSLSEESFVDGIFEAPQYTKPPVFRDMEVPEVLRSGDHRAIAIWRRREGLRLTLERRPDLIDLAPLTKEDKIYIEQLRSKQHKS